MGWASLPARLPIKYPTAYQELPNIKYAHEIIMGYGALCLSHKTMNYRAPNPSYRIHFFVYSLIAERNYVETE